MKSVLLAILVAGMGGLPQAPVCAIAQESQPIRPISDPAQRGDSELDLVVLDGPGAVIANASVSVSQAETGTKVEGKTNNAGRFRASELAPGKYAVRTEQLGFKPADTPVDLDAHDARQITIKMLVAPTDLRGDRMYTAPGVETQTSTLDHELLGEPPSPAATERRAQEPSPQKAPQRSSLRRFFSALGRKLGL